MLACELRGGVASGRKLMDGIQVSIRLLMDAGCGNEGTL